MTKKEKRFVATVYDFYQQHGRHTLPWRETYDPYHVWISEVMLQQTQVERVIPKYQAFLEIFPDIHTLAGASLSAVLIQWQGLGYNRRAKMLHACANEVVSSFSGKFPDTFNALTQLPGIGPYTAGALLAFAYNTPVPIIETNIRTAYIHHFFSEITEVTDAKILQCIEKTLNKENPREWYWALMDYGAFLKSKYGSINNKSKHYKKQTKFQGSDRQIRGAIVRVLAHSTHPINRTSLIKELHSFESVRIDTQLKKLTAEGLVVKDKYTYFLPK